MKPRRRIGLALFGIATALALAGTPVAAQDPVPPLDPAATPAELALLELVERDELLTARREAEALLQSEPDSVVGHYVLGRVLHSAEGALPQAMRELGRARELYERQHPPQAESPGWRLHQQILYATAWVALEMEEFDFQLTLLDYHDELYTPRAAGEHAWPLMRLRRFDRAREFAALAIESRQAIQRAYGYNALCALEGEAQEREAHHRACLKALEHKRSLPPDATTTGGIAVDAYNAALAALGNFRTEEAEALALEGARRFAITTANPWRILVDLRMSQGRAGQALDALRELSAWRRRQPANVRAQERAQTDAVAAKVFLLAGEAERGLALADGLVAQPDRRGLTTATRAQTLAGHALLRRALRRLSAEVAAERRSWSDAPSPSWWSHAERSLEDWALARADEERVVGVAADRSVLVASLRPYLSGGLEDVPPWMVGDLVDVLGPGVVIAAIDGARSDETATEAGAYFDAHEAEATLVRGDESRALALANMALQGLPSTEALLRARVAAVAWQAAGARTAVGLGFLEQALALDGGVPRRMGWRVPVRLDLPDDALGRELGRLLSRSPRLDVGRVGVVVQIARRAEGTLVCLTGAASGAEIRCGAARHAGPGEGTVPATSILARGLAEALHRDVLAMPIGLTGADLGSLDGSTTASGEAVREKLERLLEEGSGTTEPNP